MPPVPEPLLRIFQLSDYNVHIIERETQTLFVSRLRFYIVKGFRGNTRVVVKCTPTNVNITQ